MKKKIDKLLPAPTNGALLRYLDITEIVADLSAEKKEIRDAIVQHGPLSTRDFIATVDDVSQERMVSVEEALKIMPREELIRHGLLQVVESTRVTVKRKAKASA